ncbi:MAG: 50S ribosomal protein L3 N(5)-glutamine methyltransferase [Chromatocurvus sp.]
MSQHLPQRPDLAPAASVIEAIQACARVLETGDVFFGHGTDNAWDEAVQLVLFAVGQPPDAPSDVGERPLVAADRERIESLLQRRVHQRIPLPYLTGEAWFAGLRFACDGRALVPRSPLAELVLGDFRPWYAGTGPVSILDLCCGGGAIGIAAAVQLPRARVVLSDVDGGALALASTNVLQHGVGDRVRTVQGDLFCSLADERFDIILCNPPYVDASDLGSMPAEYAHEPPIGLGAGSDGLDLARRVLNEAADHLNPEGLLLLEVGNSWTALEVAFPRVAFTWVELEAGGHGVLAMQASELRESAASLAYTGA